MSQSFEDLGIHLLSVDQRIALAQEILDSVIASRPPEPLSEAMQQELERRFADYVANPNDMISWEEIERETFSRFNK